MFIEIVVGKVQDFKYWEGTKASWQRAQSVHAVGKTERTFTHKPLDDTAMNRRDGAP